MKKTTRTAAAHSPTASAASIPIVIRVWEVILPFAVALKTFLNTGQPPTRTTSSQTGQGTRLVATSKSPSHSPTTAAKRTAPKTIPNRVRICRVNLPPKGDFASPPFSVSIMEYPASSTALRISVSPAFVGSMLTTAFCAENRISTSATPVTAAMASLTCRAQSAQSMPLTRTSIFSLLSSFFPIGITPYSASTAPTLILPLGFGIFTASPPHIAFMVLIASFPSVLLFQLPLFYLFNLHLQILNLFPQLFDFLPRTG